MNKRLFFSVALSLLCGTLCLKAQEVTDPPRTIMVSIANLKAWGYNGAKVPDKTTQPISSKDDAISFIRKIASTNDAALTTLQGSINTFVQQTDKKQNDKHAIIVIKHPLDLKKLYADDTKKQGDQAVKYIATLSKKKSLNDFVALIDSRVEAIKKDAIRAAFKKGTIKAADTLVFTQDLLTAEVVRQLNDLKILRQNTLDQIPTLDKDIEDQKAAFLEVSSEIKEDDKIESLILDYQNKEWTDYMLDVDEILYVLIGGPDDIQRGKVSIDNKPSAFQTDLHDLITVGSAVLAGNTLRDQIKLNEEIPVTFLVVKSNKIKAPSTLEYTVDGKDKKFTNDIHEKARFGIRLGVSAAFVDRKNFSLDAQNELTIVTDDAKKTELKSNLIALIEFSPWGRDIDRLESVLGKNKDIEFLDWNRLSFVAGLRLSKDPLQSLYGGISYAMSKTAALNFGISFNRTPKDISKLPVGVDATLDYLKENADQELIPKLFFGLSFSPKFLGKALGIVK